MELRRVTTTQPTGIPGVATPAALLPVGLRGCAHRRGGPRSGARAESRQGGEGRRSGAAATDGNAAWGRDAGRREPGAHDVRSSKNSRG